MLIAMKCRIPVVSVGRPGMNLGTHEGRKGHVKVARK